MSEKPGRGGGGGGGGGQKPGRGGGPTRPPGGGGRPIASMERGGKVRKTGNYRLHEGERVVPRDKVKKRSKKRSNSRD